MPPVLPRYMVTPQGLILKPDGSLFDGPTIDSSLLDVQHLASHVETYALAREDRINVLVTYSCHCWTCAHDPVVHGGQTLIMDGQRARVHDAVRHQASFGLADLIREIDQHRIYVTASERNFGVYNAVFVAGGTAYTAYFVMRPDKGRFNGVRHKLQLFVESAYHAAQPEQGSKTSLTAVIAAALRGDKVKYRR